MARLHVPGVPPDVEVRASARRRRTVTAFREQGRLVVVVPARMPREQIPGYVQDLVRRLTARERRRSVSDTQLAARAAELSARYLEGRPTPTSVRWVDNQNSRWGSTTPAHGTIRLSTRLATMPAYVVDAVLVHELAHLLVPGHGPDFRAWEARYPRLAEAQAFLAGYEHARAAGAEDAADGAGGDGAEVGDDGAEVGGEGCCGEVDGQVGGQVGGDADEVDLRDRADAPAGDAAATLW